MNVKLDLAVLSFLWEKSILLYDSESWNDKLDVFQVDLWFLPCDKQSFIHLVIFKMGPSLSGCEYIKESVRIYLITYIFSLKKRLHQNHPGTSTTPQAAIKESQTLWRIQPRFVNEMLNGELHRTTTNTRAETLVRSLNNRVTIVMLLVLQKVKVRASKSWRTGITKRRTRTSIDKIKLTGRGNSKEIEILRELLFLKWKSNFLEMLKLYALKFLEILKKCFLCKGSD